MIKIISNQQNLKFDVSVFHGGEVNFRFENDLSQRGVNEVTIQAQIRSSEDLITLLMATDALRQFGVETIHLFMPYCPYGRQDRICNTGEALSIKVFTDLIHTQGYKTITIFDPHSDVQTALLNAKVRDNYDFIEKAYHQIPLTEKEGEGKSFPIIVAPDAGASKKISKIAEKLNKPFIQATKSRDLDSRELTNVEVYGDVNGKNCVIIDDICSGGGTFINLGQKLKEMGANNLYLIVSHMEGEYGLQRILGSFDHVFTTNSMGELPQLDGVSVYDLFEAKDE
jgi:ribose-phosphate pyrophosphokinase